MDSVTILGARGSVPRAGAEYAKYGGTTTCILVSLAGETILLDAGTGLMELDCEDLGGKKNVALLLTHPHVDHLLGLPLCPLLLDPDFHMDIYVRSRSGQSGKEQLERFLSPPLWPVRLEELPGKTAVHELPAAFSLGRVRIETMEGIHPGGVTLLKLSADSRSIVFVTDCTLTEAILPELTEFARGCSLLLCDGQYSREEFQARRDFGHSSWEMAAELGLRCGAERVRVIHHDPQHTDLILDAAAPDLAALHSGASFAMAREEICL